MSYDLIIIGSGPGGYVAGIRAGQVGLKTAIIEKGPLGGMCLNWGCIPTKALLESAKRFDMIQKAEKFGITGIQPDQLSFVWEQALSRSSSIVGRLTKGVAFLLEKNKVELIWGEAAIQSENEIMVGKKKLETKHMIIATGSRPVKNPFPVPENLIVEIDELLKLKDIPQRMVILGEGAHAFELGQFFKLIGKEVTILVPREHLLPQVDPYLEEFALKLCQKNKIEVIQFSEIRGYQKKTLHVDARKLPCDMIVNCSLREAILPSSKIELEMNEGFLKVASSLETNIDGIYGVGDVNGESMFAHAASAQGLHAVNHIKGIRKDWSSSRIPINIYSSPEMAQVGLSEPQVKKQNLEYRIDRFPMTANGKALIEDDTRGFLRLISEKRYGEVLGVQIVAPHATDLISEASLLMEMEGTVHEFAQTIHAHPTISEVYMEAGLVALDQPIHQ